MCGIVGIFDIRDRRPISRNLLSEMNDSQFHRGPDESGLYIDSGIGLGHRRLSIIDITSGQQPLFNEDQSVVVVYNGEIYNFPELACELKCRGHVFRTHSDTEVIVHAWEEWGEDCVRKFRGMFAFAIWDKNNRTLFLARDRLGIKPLYYAALSDGYLIFSSELKALLKHPGMRREMDPCAIEDYFSYGYIPEPKTIFMECYKLSPGHTVRLKQGSFSPIQKKYWDLNFQSTCNGTENDVADELISRFRDAVKVRLISEVPLGAFLSGGVDSSAVVAMMSELSDKPVNTCSIAFAEADFDESNYANIVANRYQTNHHVGTVRLGDFDLIDNLADLYDEPYADSSAMPTYRVCELAKRKVTVALSGDGGDEHLAGYRRYRWHLYEEKMRDYLPLGLRRPLFGALGHIYPKADWAPKMLRAKATFETLARSSVEGYFHSISLLGDQLRKQLFSSAFKRSLQGYHAVDVLKMHEANAPEHPLSKIQYLDIKTYLVGDILTKVDRASMAHSLEVRVPLLDHQLVEWFAGIPPELKLKGAEGKYILKKSLESRLPPEILYRNKMGFAVPLAEWFRNGLQDRLRGRLMSDAMRDIGCFNHKFIDTLIKHHNSGRRDNSAALWSLMMFEAFYRKLLS